MQKFWGIAVATIEGLAFGARPLREADEVIKKGSLSKGCAGMVPLLSLHYQVLGDSRSNHWRFSFRNSLFKGTRRSRAASMSERSELRSCREEWMKNSVKNLKGSEAIPQNLFWLMEKEKLNLDYSRVDIAADVRCRQFLWIIQVTFFLQELGL